MVFFVRRREYFAFVDIVNFQRLENIGFREVSDTDFCHHGNAHRLHDLADLGDAGHAGDAAFLADVGRNALEGHDRHRARLLGNLGLLGVGDVHDDAAFEHFRQTDFKPKIFSEVHKPSSQQTQPRETSRTSRSEVVDNLGD